MSTKLLREEVDNPEAIMKHAYRITRVWVVFRGDMYVYAVYCWHSEAMPIRREELLERLG